MTAGASLPLSPVLVDPSRGGTPGVRPDTRRRARLTAPVFILPIACAAAGSPAAHAQTLPSSIAAGATVTIANGQLLAAAGTVSNQGTVAVNGTSSATVLDVTGGFTLTGGGTLLLGGQGFSGVANGTNPVTQTLTNQDNTITGSGLIGPALSYFYNGNTGASLALANKAAGILLAGSGGNLTFSLSGLTNAGLATAINGGTLTLNDQGAFSNSGTVLASQGGLVNLGSGNSGTNTGIIQASGGGTVAMNLMLANAGGTVLAQGAGSAVIVTGGTIAGGTVQASGGGSIALSAGTIQSAVLTGGGTIAASGGTLSAVSLGSGTSLAVQNGATVGMSGLFANAGTLAIGGTSQESILSITGSTTLTSGGTVTLAGGFSGIANASRTVSATLTNQGVIVGGGQVGPSLSVLTGAGSGSGLIVANQAGARIEASGTAGLSLAPLSMTNNGTLQADSGAKLTATGQLTNWDGAGTLTGGTYAALNGTIAFTGANIVHNAASIVLSGASGTIQDTNGNDAMRGLAANMATGSLTVTGGRTLTTSGGFSNAGVLQIGPGGTVGVTGPFSQMASGSLDFVLGESGQQLASTLDANGGMMLAGTLAVSLASGFSLSSGETFDLIHFPAGSLVSGWFSSIVLPSAPGLIVQEVTTSTDIEMTVAAVPEPPSGLALLAGLVALWRARLAGRGRRRGPVPVVIPR